ncbi:MAG: hypothetical protein IJZ76_01155 [Lachnospiraceae bacterium]|nr:hypothetical protein [Lachnospiraceae bacterium]
MKRSKNLSEIIYLTAFVLWMLIALLKLTYFKDLIPMDGISRAVQYSVLLLLLVKLIRDFEFSIGSAIEVFVYLLFMFIAYSGGRLAFPVSLALIYSAKNVSFEKILKVTLVMQAAVFVVTVVCSQIGILEDFIWDAGSRDRHGLGYTHSLLGSHFVLFMSLILVVLIGKMTIWATALILAANYLMYVFTDSNAPLILAAGFVVLAWIARLLEKYMKPVRGLSWLVSVVPLSFWGFCVWIVNTASWDSVILNKANIFLHGRLSLMCAAWENYGMTLFGQKIKWVGESTVKNNPDLLYNYVDNAYMQSMFNYGILFVILLCVGFGIVLYRNMQKGNYLMVAALAIVLVHGMINPQLVELAYNPFLLLLSGAFCFGKAECKKG